MKEFLLAFIQKYFGKDHLITELSLDSNNDWKMGIKKVKYGWHQ